MNHTQHNQIVGFIWSIADDVLRDVYTRGKYRDLILPFTVLRRLDALLDLTFKLSSDEYTFHFSNEEVENSFRVFHTLVPNEVKELFGEQEHYHTRSYK